MKNVIVLGGSPRIDGCTAFLVKQIGEALGTEQIMLVERDIKMCQGCMVCLDNKTDCVIKDDSQGIIRKIQACDLVVFVIPNYIHNVPGMFKNFIDRLLPVYGQEPKRSVFVYIGAGGLIEDPQDAFDAVSAATWGMKKYLGFDCVKEFAFMCTNKPDIVVQQARIDEMIREIRAIM